MRYYDGLRLPSRSSAGREKAVTIYDQIVGSLFGLCTLPFRIVYRLLTSEINHTVPLVHVSIRSGRTVFRPEIQNRTS